jgi:DNA polymerase-3 subunit alpha
MVYQEQVMQIVRDIAGYSLGRADLVRRAMGKKKLDVMAKERENFIHGIVDENGNVVLPGAVRNGVDEKSANTIFDEMSEFAKYAFNKSHAACYAVVAYRTAYLKTYFPTEFMAALLNSFISALNKIPEYINECKRMNIVVLRPDINRSFSRFTVDGDSIRFGLAAIKNVGEGAINSITNEREKNGEFKNFIDFCERISSEDVNKKCVESMIKAGAFDNFGTNRNTLLKSFETILDAINSDRKRSLSGQVTMFDTGKETKSNELYKYNECEELSKKELLSMEKDMLGLYVSGHPLDNFRDKIEKISTISSSDILTEADENVHESEMQLNSKIEDGAFVKYIGIISNIKTKITKSSEIMAFLTVEDLSGAIQILVFPKTYTNFKNIIQEDSIVMIEGRLSIRGDEEPTIIALKMSLFNTEEKKEEIPKNKVLEIKIPDNLPEEGVKDLRDFIKKICNDRPNCNGELCCKGQVKVLPMFVNEKVIKELKEKVKEENIRWK